jgi:hypothetical protein
MKNQKRQNKKQKMRENLELNALESKLTHKRIELYGCVIRMNKERIPKKSSEHKRKMSRKEIETKMGTRG